MTESITPAGAPDTIDAVAGLRDGDAVAALRRAREKVLLHTRLSEAALFDPALPDLSLTERLHVARYVAQNRMHWHWPRLIAHDWSRQAARSTISHTRTPMRSTHCLDAPARSLRMRAC